MGHDHVEQQDQFTLTTLQGVLGDSPTNKKPLYLWMKVSILRI